MKNLTSKIGKYLSELATQLLKVLCEVMIEDQNFCLCGLNFFQNCRFANFSFQSDKYIANFVYLRKQGLISLILFLHLRCL